MAATCSYATPLHQQFDVSTKWPVLCAEQTDININHSLEVLAAAAMAGLTVCVAGLDGPLVTIAAAAGLPR